MKDTLVTAVYHSSFESRMGGRNCTFEYYENPFRNLLNLDKNIIVFSHQNEIDKIRNFFDRNNFSNYKIMDYDLNNYILSDKIYQLKEEQQIIDKNGLKQGSPSYLNHRNTHLCLMKINFLNMAISGNYFDSENYYWVDAGLFHNGIIPNSFGGMEKFLTPVESTFWPSNQNNICKPGLIEKLKIKNNNANLLFVGIEHIFRPTWWFKITQTNKKIHIIGGIFGGNRDAITNLHKKFNSIVEKIFELNELTLEEDILSIIVLENEYDYIKFSSWYHDIVTDSCYYGISTDTNSFYKIFLDWQHS